MAQFWKERRDSEKHRDFMTGHQDAGGRPLVPVRDNLLESWVFFVQVPDCLLQFTTVPHLVEARDYFSKKIQPARRARNVSLEHYWQRWFERLPPGIHRKANRLRMLKALDGAIEAIEKGTMPVRTS